MSNVETAAFATLWLLLVCLAALVLLLYHQIDRLYARQAALSSSGLAPGTAAPRLEVMTDEATAVLPDVGADSPALLFFGRTDCPVCIKLLRELSEHEVGVRLVALLAGDGNSKDYGKNFEVYWAAYPDVLVREWGIAAYPTAYLVNGGKVVTSSTVTTVDHLRGMLGSAASDQNKSRANGDHHVAQNP